MAEKKEEIKRILRRKVRTGARVTEQQLSEAAERVSALKSVDKQTLANISESVVGDGSAFICASTDLGDINNLLKGGGG